MKEQDKYIRLSHGSGGKLMHDIINDLFIRHVNNPMLTQKSDSAILENQAGSIAFTTDSFVVDPIFFPGGDIGKLAVCGTVNDIAVSGARPKYITSSFIIEEGFPVEDLEKIVVSMAREAKDAGIEIVTGDTKVVNIGQCDKVFINTTGIGFVEEKFKHIGSGSNIKPGDKIIVNGNIADHGMAILKSRKDISLEAEIFSDCTCLNGLIQGILEASDGVRFMRDATRGGLAAVLCELAGNNRIGIEVDESSVPVNENVRGMCEIFGFDPMYVANEGKVVIVVDGFEADKILEVMKQDEKGRDSAIIGEIKEEHLGKVIMNTEIGGSRIVDLPVGEQLPRIC